MDQKNKVIISALQTQRRHLIDVLNDYMKNDIAQPMYKGSDLIVLMYNRNNIAERGDSSLVFLADKVVKTLVEHINNINEVDKTIEELESASTK